MGIAGVLSLVAFSVLWALSNRGFNYVRFSNGYLMDATSWRGRVSFAIVESDSTRVPTGNSSGWRSGIFHNGPGSDGLPRLRPPFGLRLNLPEQLSVAAPHWFLVALSALTAALAAKPPVRFTIRTLLVTLTVAAVLLGALVVASR